MKKEISKECFKCNIIKPLVDYYKHPKTADGRFGKCKDCTKNDTKKRDEILCKDPVWVEQEQKRHRDKYHRLDYKDKRKPTTEQKRVFINRYKEKYPEKVKAKSSVKGNKEGGVENHHWSYKEEHYKDVIPLNFKDHAKAHRFLEYDQNFFMYRRRDNGQLLDAKDYHLSYILDCINNKD